LIILKIAVIADDLTGALDTGVQFKNFGLTVEVAPILDKLQRLHKASDVVVVNTESRYLKPGEAFKRVKEAALNMGDPDVWYKKIDSTLRGNIGAELDALMKYTDETCSIVAPAFPQANRTTMEGFQYVNGVPLYKTEYAKELSNRSSFIPDIIGSQTDRKVISIDLGDVRRGTEHLRERVLRILEDGYEIIVIDSFYERDLRSISKACKDFKVWSGSAGLASELPEGLGFITSLPVLVVCGSMRTVTRDQVRVLEDHFGVEKFTLEEERIDGAQLEKLVKDLGEAVAVDKDVVIMTSSEPINTDPESCEDNLVASLAEITAKLLETNMVSGLVMTGGATSLGVCERTGVDSMEILGEVRPGIPFLKLSTGVKAVTKAGGFGDEYALMDAVNYLRRCGP
jgi:uncharacterized protein YgbK (DUF1537 family)